MSLPTTYTGLYHDQIFISAFNIIHYRYSSNPVVFNAVGPRPESLCVGKDETKKKTFANRDKRRVIAITQPLVCYVSNDFYFFFVAS